MRRVMVAIFMLSTAFVFAGSLEVAEAKMFIYPEKGQTKEQQELDEFQCHKWAVEQTGIDPAQVAQQGSGAQQSSGGGEVAGGAAKGAALGAIGGAVAGDAGKGAAVGAAVGAGGGAMKKRRRGRQQQQQQQQAAQQKHASIDEFNRAFGLCLQGRGYRVG